MTLPQFCLWLSIAFACGWFLARWLTFAAATAEAGRLHRAACNEKACARLMRENALAYRHDAEVAEARADLARREAEATLGATAAMARHQAAELIYGAAAFRN